MVRWILRGDWRSFSISLLTHTLSPWPEGVCIAVRFGNQVLSPGYTLCVHIVRPYLKQNKTKQETEAAMKHSLRQPKIILILMGCPYHELYSVMAKDPVVGLVDAASSGHLKTLELSSIPGRTTWNDLYLIWLEIAGGVLWAQHSGSSSSSSKVSSLRPTWLPIMSSRIAWVTQQDHVWERSKEKGGGEREGGWAGRQVHSGAGHQCTGHPPQLFCADTFGFPSTEWGFWARQPLLTVS